MFRPCRVLYHSPRNLPPPAMCVTCAASVLVLPRLNEFSAIYVRRDRRHKRGMEFEKQAEIGTSVQGLALMFSS